MRMAKQAYSTRVLLLSDVYYAIETLEPRVEAQGEGEARETNPNQSTYRGSHQELSVLLPVSTSVKGVDKVPSGED